MEKKMTETSLSPGAISKQAKPIDQDWDGNQSWWSFTAYLCFAGCISFGVIGLFLSGINYFIAPGGFGSKIGMVLVFAAFPLMLFGSHALDKVAESEKKDK